MGGRENEAGENTIEILLPMNADRADKALLPFFSGWSRTRVQALFVEGRVWRDDAALAKKNTVRAGEILTVFVPPARETTLRPIPLPLDILYEDEDLLVVNKAPGMVVHPGSGTGDDTLAHGLLFHCGPSLAEVGSPERPGIVHRLDKETSGVMVAAKTARAYLGLVDAFSGRRCEKDYIAIVSGSPAGGEGEIREPIGRHPVHRQRMAVVASGRPAHSQWRVKERLGSRFTVVEVTILTGRTHQIRVHMAWLGHPLAGDPTYGYRPGGDDPAVPRVMLHAARLVIPHPVSGRWSEFSAVLPEDMQDYRTRLAQPPTV